MACLALCAIAPAVHILQLVTIVACMRQIFVALARMTDCALHFDVRPNEWEFRLLVIECFGLPP